MIAENRYLTLAEMTENATYIFNQLKLSGWSEQAICAILGNMQSESTINAGIWESLDYGNMSGGYGLVQWTPATKITDWLDSNNYDWLSFDGQLARINYEIANGLQWGSTETYPMTFEEFKVSTQTAEYLADVFLYNYERPADLVQTWRATQAGYWWDLLHTVTPVVTKKHKMKIFMYKLF